MQPPPPPPFPPPPPPPAPASVTAAGAGGGANAGAGSQLGRKSGLPHAHARLLGGDPAASAWQMTPGKAVLLWLALVGVFLMLLPRLWRNKRARLRQRSD